MKKVIRRITIIVLVFLIAIVGVTVYQGQQNQQQRTYVPLASATLPVVELDYQVDSEDEDNTVHALYGYTTEMVLSSIHGSITPLSENRQVTVRLNPYGQTIQQVRYQLRSADGSVLIEDGTLNKWEAREDGLEEQTLQFANLLENGVEYVLKLEVETAAKNVYYYGRIFYSTENYTDSMLQFAHEFSAATYSDDPVMIANYLQPNDTMGTDDFGFINIHSSYRMFIWDGLDPVVMEAASVQITELTETQMAVTLNYPIQLTVDGVTAEYEVEEYFVIRNREGQLYLLDYYRKTNQKFSMNDLVLSNGSIWLGITSEECQQITSPDGNIQVFCFQNQVFSYDSNTNTISRIFTFRDGTDSRSLRNQYQISLVQVDDQGTMDFMVYGYQNRGQHEGEVGISFYRYFAEERSMDELFYISSTYSEEFMMADIGGLSYVNGTDQLYLLYGNTVYSIDLASGEKLSIATQQSTTGFYYNQTGSRIAWMEGVDLLFPERICLMDLDTGTLTTIRAEENEFLLIQGFIGNDLVYGSGHTDEVLQEAGVITQRPMYRLTIVSGEGEENSGEYELSGIFIMSVEVNDSSLRLARAHKTENGYQSIEDDVILRNQRESSQTVSAWKIKNNGAKRNEAYLSLELEPSRLTYVNDTVKYSAAEEAYLLNIGRSSMLETEYRVYGLGQLLAVETQLDTAIQQAYDSMGCVMNSQNEYLWTRGTRALTKSLAVQQQVVTKEEESLQAALSMFLSFQNASDAQLAELLETEVSVVTILEEALPDVQVLNLYGTALSQVLYYVHLGNPVLAVNGSHSAVLIIGYTTTEVTVYNPYMGVTSVMSMEEATTFFQEMGNPFISCLG